MLGRLWVLGVVVSAPLLATTACEAPANDGVANQSPVVEDSRNPMDQHGPDPRFQWPQHENWTIDRHASQKFRVVAYGDSIFAGYQGSPWQVARRSAPYVAGEYLAQAWDANVEVVRRTVSGALSSEVAANIETDKSYMQSPSVRAAYFEMCGNDYLQARDAFKQQSGTCNYRVFSEALATCVASTSRAMDVVNANATTARTKAVSTLYYPGFDADNVMSRCQDPQTHQTMNVRDKLLPLIAQSNWHTCDLARQKGFACVDTFAEFMAADYDTNGDGKVDSEALAFDPNESEVDYVTRITVTLRGTLTDAKKKALAPGVVTNYLFSDDTHPLAYKEMIDSGRTGVSAPDFAPADLATGANPQWNRYGHERMGWALWQAGPSALTP